MWQIFQHLTEGGGVFVLDEVDEVVKLILTPLTESMVNLFVLFLIREEFLFWRLEKNRRDIPRLVLPVRLPAMLLADRQ